MRKSCLRLLAVVILAGTFSAVAPCAQAIVVANWRFEPGNFFTDSSGNGHTLTGNASSSAAVANLSGGLGSAQFDGTSQFLQTLAPIDLTPYSQIRVSFAIRNAGTISGQGFGTVIEQTVNQNSNNGAFFVDVDELGPGVGTATLKMNVGATQSHNIDQLPSANNGTDWDLYVIEYDPTNASVADVVKVTRNGSLLADTTAFGLHGTIASQSFLNDIVYLGARGALNNHFNGNIDEVMIEGAPFTLPPTPAPEPSTLALLGCAALFFARRKR